MEQHVESSDPTMAISLWKMTKEPETIEGNTVIWRYQEPRDSSNASATAARTLWIKTITYGGSRSWRAQSAKNMGIRRRQCPCILGKRTESYSKL